MQLAPLTTTRPSAATPARLSWKTVRYHPRHAAAASPIFMKTVPVRLDQTSVASPLLLLNTMEDRLDTVTVVPAAVQGMRELTSVTAKHNTVLFGNARRELVILLFHRSLDIERYPEGSKYHPHLHKVKATLRGFTEEFHIQLNPKALQAIVDLRTYLNHAIMIPEHCAEENKIGAGDMEELLAELDKLNLQDKVGAFAKQATDRPESKELKKRDDAHRALFELDDFTGRKDIFCKLWANPRIVVNHTVAAQSCLNLNQRLLADASGCSIFLNPDLMTIDEIRAA